MAVLAAPATAAYPGISAALTRGLALADAAGAPAGGYAAWVPGWSLSFGDIHFVLWLFVSAAFVSNLIHGARWLELVGGGLIDGNLELIEIDQDQTRTFGGHVDCEHGKVVTARPNAVGLGGFRKVSHSVIQLMRNYGICVGKGIVQPKTEVAVGRGIVGHKHSKRTRMPPIRRLRRDNIERRAVRQVC